jgi:hypothetical protein
MSSDKNPEKPKRRRRRTSHIDDPEWPDQYEGRGRERSTGNMRSAYHISLRYTSDVQAALMRMCEELSCSLSEAFRTAVLFYDERSPRGASEREGEQPRIMATPGSPCGSLVAKPFRKTPQEEQGTMGRLAARPLPYYREESE